MGPGSEMRRAARALVEAQTRTFRSSHPLSQAVERLSAAAREPAPKVLLEASSRAVTARRIGDSDPFFVASWQDGAEGPELRGEFPPPRWALRVLKLCSLGLAALIGATLWAFLADEPAALKIPLAVFTVVAVLAFPYVVLAISSQWTALQANVSRAITRALKTDDQ